MAVFHHHAAFAIEHEAARRPQRERALMVVLGHFVVLLVLHDLEDPEADGEERKRGGDDGLEACQSSAGFATVFNHHRLPRF